MEHFVMLLWGDVCNVLEQVVLCVKLRMLLAEPIRFTPLVERRRAYRFEGRIALDRISALSRDRRKTPPVDGVPKHSELEPGGGIPPRDQQTQGHRQICGLTGYW